MRKKTASPGLLNSWLLFVTVLIIVIAFVLYSFVYVKNNEKEQIAKRFRVLAQVGENIGKKRGGFKKIAKNVEKGAKDNSRKALKDKAKKANPILKVAAEEKIRDNHSILKLNVVKNNNNPGTLDYVIYAEAKDFFDPLRRPDMFDEFIVLQAEDGVLGTFATHDLPSLAVGNGWDVHYMPKQVILSVVTVPEPSASLLGAIGIVALLARRTRSRRS